ncbi:MAG TPA: hypothetical protein VL306_01785, partial [Methylomirabilota bacterium]|nr:hypothetical protein [Methylomirabilota bacterium]
LQQIQSLNQHLDTLLSSQCDDEIVPQPGIKIKVGFLMDQGKFTPQIIFGSAATQFVVQFTPPLSIQEYIGLKVDLDNLPGLVRNIEILEQDVDDVIIVLTISGRRFEFETSRQIVEGIFKFLQPFPDDTNDDAYQGSASKAEQQEH